MSAEAEKVLEQAASVRNVTNKRGKLVQPATRYLRHNERQKRLTELNRIKNMLSRQNVYDTNIGEESKKMAMIHAARLEEDLEEHSPPTDLSGETKNRLLDELRREEAIYVQGMVSQEEMRRNPTGAVDRHMKHTKVNRDRALKIKNLRMLLDPESDEQDLCNLENLRPSISRQDGAATFMPDAQIPGVFAMTPQAKANWPEQLTEYPESSPLMQAERAELEQLRRENAERKAKWDAGVKKRQANYIKKGVRKMKKQLKAQGYVIPAPGETSPPELPSEQDLEKDV